MQKVLLSNEIEKNIIILLDSKNWLVKLHKTVYSKNKYQSIWSRTIFIFSIDFFFHIKKLKNEYLIFHSTVLKELCRFDILLLGNKVM